MKNDNNDSLKTLVLTAVGIAIFIMLAIVIIYFSFDDWGQRGQFGDTFGSVNALFSGLAFAGIIYTISLQRKDLTLQRIEMQETRKEFSINRITNIIYNQLQRYEDAVMKFEIKNNQQTYFGYDAFFFLKNSKQTVYYPLHDTRTDDEILQEKKEKNCFAMKIYSTNNMSIAQFSLTAYNTVNVIKEILYKSDLPVADINNMKNIFFRNIGFINMDILKDIVEKYSEYLQLTTTENDNYIKECNLDPGHLSTASFFLKNIIGFKNVAITSDNIDHLSNQLSTEIGDIA